MKELPKAYEPQKYEDKIYAHWENSGFFDPDECKKAGVVTTRAENFSIVLPPPNVTGTLHMGHAAMLAIEDVIVRYHRMKGDRTLWLPGTDHAAIATQSKVERLLMEKGMKDPKKELGREKFLVEVNKFARESHDTIVNQCKKMGASLDWSREAFTLDEKRNLAVRTVFQRMYNDGLIYRGNRLVNWDPKMQSNVADDEIVWKAETAPFYYFQYGPFVIGTARPETKFGDKYVVMHPADRRYVKYKHGQKINLEWINGPIVATVIKDEAIDMKFGTGVMTITPWHDAVDFEIAERHGLDKEQIIGLDGKLFPVAGEFVGMDAREARKKIVEKIQAKGLVVKIDRNYRHNIATDYRGGGLIEPQIREQWFISVDKKFKLNLSKINGVKSGQLVSLKQLMQKTVKNGQIEIIPERFDRVYFHWIDNLRDWCISRQIWYGHQIPVWYCHGSDKNHCEKDCKMPIVSVDTPESCPACGSRDLARDPDTLDTWFSAGLWTFSTLGWPRKTLDLKDFHPTSMLETGYDILFFWVARMILMTTYTLGDIPFEKVYLHGLVRDEQGKKMSKELGNIIDPLDMINKYGADATRLSLLLGCTPGNDVKLSDEKIQGFRNFTNKLWNISRFIILQMDGNVILSEAKNPLKSKNKITLADGWILNKLNAVVELVTDNIEKNNFAFAGEQLRDFTWGHLADWYLEIVKIEGGKSKILNYILNNILKLWHPFMPFVTEAIWKEVYGDMSVLMIEKWPTAGKIKKVKDDFDNIQKIIGGIRALCAENKITPGRKLNCVIGAGKHEKLLQGNIRVIIGLARLEKLEITKKVIKPANAVGFVASGVEVYVDLAGEIDTGKEKIRLEKEIAGIKPYAGGLKSKLANVEFIKNAPPAVVEKEKQKLAEAEEKLSKLFEQLVNLK